MEKFENKFNYLELPPEKIFQLEKIRKDIENIGDRLGMSIDEKIKEVVIMCNAVGLPTSASCEGHIDHGIPVPWIEISAPNEPRERFIGQQEVFEKIAKKYGITTEEIERGEIMTAYWEALKECSQNGETEEYKKWKKENKKLLNKAKLLLEKFYKNREVDPELKLEIDDGEEYFRIHNGGKDYKPIGKNEFSESEREERLKRLEKYRAEMNAFAEFLKKEYFLNNK